MKIILFNIFMFFGLNANCQNAEIVTKEVFVKIENSTSSDSLMLSVFVKNISEETIYIPYDGSFLIKSPNYQFYKEDTKSLTLRIGHNNRTNGFTLEFLIKLLPIQAQAEIKFTTNKVGYSPDTKLHHIIFDYILKSHLPVTKKNEIYPELNGLDYYNGHSVIRIKY